MTNMILTFLAIITISLISAILYTWLFAWFYCKPGKYVSNKNPQDYGLPARSVEFRSQGKKLTGWLIAENLNNKTDRLVILVHGWSANSTLLLPIARFLFNSGLNLFLYDSRGHGQSENDGPITIRKMAQDVSAALDYVFIKTKASKLKITVMGHSMGASAAILAASDDLRIERIVACSPFSDPKKLTIRHIKQKKIPMGILIHLVFYFIERWLGTKMKNIAPLNRIKYICQDILLVHGTQDRIIPCSDSVLLNVAHHPYRTTLLKIERRGHFDILRDPTVMKKAVDFINGKADSLSNYNQPEQSVDNSDYSYSSASRIG